MMTFGDDLNPVACCKATVKKCVLLRTYIIRHHMLHACIVHCQTCFTNYNDITLAGNDVLCYAVAAVCYCATWAMSQVCCCSVVVLVAGFTLELIFAMSSMLYCCFSCFHFCFLISYFATAFFVAFLYLAYQSKERKKEVLLYCHQRNSSTFDWVFFTFFLLKALLSFAVIHTHTL